MITLELKLDRDLYGELLEGINEYREKMLNAASEYYGITKEELEQLLQEKDEELRNDISRLDDWGERFRVEGNEYIERSE